MTDKKCEAHSSEISDIRGDIKAILAILKSAEFVRQEKLYSEVEKIHNRINKTVIGLVFIALTLGSTVGYFIKNGV